MKKILFVLIMLSAMLFLGACGSEEEVANDSKEEVSNTNEDKGSNDSEDKVKENELVINIDGKEEVIAAELVETTLSDKSVKLKTTDDFNLSAQKGEIFLNGKNELEGIILNVSERIVNLDAKEEAIAKTIAIGLIKNTRNAEITELDVFNYPELNGKYMTFARAKGEIETKYGFATASGSEIINIKVTFPNNLATPENEALIRSIVGSLEF